MGFIARMGSFAEGTLDNASYALGFVGSNAAKGAKGALQTLDKTFIATPIAYYGAEAVNATGYVKVNSTEMAKYVFLVGVVYNFVRGILTQEDKRDEINNKKLVEYTAASAVALLVAHKANFVANSPQLVVASAVAYKIVDLVYPRVLEYINKPAK